MAEPIEFLTCSFCGRNKDDEHVNFIIRSSISKHSCVCDICVRGLSMLIANCYNGMLEDAELYGYSLD